MSKCSHTWRNGDCTKCGVSYAEAYRGFGSNVTPRKQRSWKETGGSPSRKRR